MDITGSTGVPVEAPVVSPVDPVDALLVVLSLLVVPLFSAVIPLLEVVFELWVVCTAPLLDVLPFFRETLSPPKNKQPLSMNGKKKDETIQ